MQEEEENRSKERTRPSKNKLKIMTSINKLQNRPESSTVRKLWFRKSCENRWGGEMENKEAKIRDLKQAGKKE